MSGPYGHKLASSTACLKQLFIEWLGRIAANSASLCGQLSSSIQAHRGVVLPVAPFVAMAHRRFDSSSTIVEGGVCRHGVTTSEPQDFALQSHVWNVLLRR